MQTIKTAVVVVLLLGVCYGAYVALNAPEPTLPDTLQDWNEDGLALNVEDGAAVEIPQLSKTPPPGELDSLAPPSVAPPAPAGPAAAGPSLANPASTSHAAPSLSLPPSLSSDSKSSKSPDTLTPPAPTNNLAGAEGKSGLGNDVPDLPDLSLPATKEGDSVALPGLPGSGLPPLPATLASTSNVANDSPLPPAPTFPGQDVASTASATPPAAVDGFPSSPGLLTASGGASSSGITMPSANKPASATAQPFAAAREQALKLANDGKLREALALMSPYFDHIEVTHQEHLDLIDLLDALAGEVIYSRRHFLESKFIVSTGDTLESIANKYRISPEALANINRMGDSRVVLAGTELKVLTGPFRGEVDLSKGELTLFLGELYAGRFPVSVGKEIPPEGSYSIVGRRRDQSYVGPDAKYIAGDDPRNPYGGYWMHLGNNISIHGSPQTSTPETESAGCISLAPLDAKEVYSLLTQGSEVVIKR